jgi:transcriptional regulator with XRE-family HTH domain
MEFHMSIAGRDSEANAGVGERIRVWRNHFGLTQIQLEERAGLAHNAVSRIENQEVSPRLETVESLASAMGLSVEQVQFGIPKSETTLRRGQAVEGNADLIVQRLNSLPPDKAVKAIGVFHRILDLME